MTPKYLCFISYKRKDEAHAKWLKGMLERYRLPGKLYRENERIPRRLTNLGDIYLDKDALRPGIMEDNLAEDMSQAKFLIVLCSRAVHDAPKYVDMEIETFLRAGHSADQIIPFIVDDAPNPEQTCFPPALQRLNGAQDLIGVSIYDHGRRQAFLKAIAHMLGLQVAELESADDRRRRRNRLTAALCALVLAAAGWMGFDYLVPKTAYYVDYTEVYGVAQGLGELTQAEIAHMESHYTITTQFHKVQELRHENSAGQLVEHSNTEYNDRPVKAVYTYKDDGTLESVAYQDTRERTVLTLAYVNSNVIDLQNAQDGTSIALSADTTALRQGSLYSHAAGESRSSILRYVVEYDQNGYVTERRYGMDTYNTPAQDASGVWGLRYVRDSLGRPVAVYYLTYTGSGNTAKGAADGGNYTVLGNKRGIGGKTYQYDGWDLILTTYVSSDGSTPVLNEGLWALCRTTYDTNHNPIALEYAGTDGQSTLCSAGYASFITEYDDRGNRVHAAFLGTGGEPLLTGEGYASWEAEYDAQGNQIRALCFGTDGKPILTSGGYAGWEAEYDTQGNQIRVLCFGTNGEPILRQGGYASREVEYDSQGNALRVSFFGTDGSPILTEEGRAGWTAEYDERGNLVRASFFGADGQPIIAQEGCAGWKMDYDSRGNLVRETYYGTDGKPISAEGGYASWETEYDEQGNQLRVAFFGADGKPVLSGDGYASWEAEYDERGNQLRGSFFGTDGRPISLAAGYASWEAEYDGRGNQIRNAYFGTDGQPVITQGGYASWEAEYDERGNQLRVAFFGADGKPIVRAGGFASQEAEYDDRGNVIRLAFFGTGGQPILREGGYASQEAQYDARGNLVLLAFFGTDGSPIVTADGFARLEAEYDEWDNLIHATFYDAAGRILAQLGYTIVQKP